MGAGAAISEGRKIRTLTAANATKKMRKMKSGAMYCRKNVMEVAV
jgi:hypothetical protein